MQYEFARCAPVQINARTLEPIEYSIRRYHVDTLFAGEYRSAYISMALSQWPRDIEKQFAKAGRCRKKGRPSRLFNPLSSTLTREARRQESNNL